MSIKIREDGIKGLLLELEEYDSIEKQMQVISELCDIGVEAVKKAYSDTNGTGNSADSVKKIKIPGGYRIEASGEAILFLEYGAGITRNNDGGKDAREALKYTDTSENIVGIGQYGLGLGKEAKWFVPPNKSTNGFFGYTKGTRARHGFANAYHAMKEAEEKIIKKVYGK